MSKTDFQRQLITKEKILTKLSDQKHFLDILLNEAEGFLSVACGKFGCSVSTMQRRLKEDEKFRNEVLATRDAWRIIRLDKIEKISFEQALIPTNVRERLFQLKAHDPNKYRDRMIIPGHDTITVVFGTPRPNFRNLDD